MVGKALGGGLGRIAGGLISSATKSVGNTPAGYTDNKYKDDSVAKPGGFGLNNEQSIPFFNSITLYQLNQQQFTSYTLVNPIIKEWSHDKLDVSGGNKVAENKMVIEFETVLYGTGSVTTDNPPGFATIHYDQSPSPLSVLGSVGNALKGSNASDLFGTLTGLQGVGNPFGKGGLGLTAAGLLMNKSVLSAGSVAVAGLSKLFNKGKAGNNPAGVDVPGAADATKITAKATGVKPAVEGFPAAEADPTDLAQYDLPDPLPEDLTELQLLQNDQEQLASTLEQQIADNEAIKASYNDAIQQAQESDDVDGLEKLYAEMEADGYTDPALLQNNLDKVNGNIGILAQAIDDAGNALNTPENTGEDGEGDGFPQTETSSDEPTQEELDAMLAETNSDEEQDEWWA